MRGSLVAQRKAADFQLFPRIYAFFTFFSDDFSSESTLGISPILGLAFSSDYPWRQPVWHLCNTVNKFAMDKKCAQLWQQLSAALKPQISADSFKRWFSAVELIEAKDKTLTLAVPNNIYQLWIESNYMPALQTAIVTTFGDPRSVKFSSLPGPDALTSGEDSAPLKEVLPGTTGRRKARYNSARTQSPEHIRIFRGRPEQ